MRFRNTVALAALFVALGAYLYFVENPRHREEAAAKKLLHFEPKDVSEITLTYPDRQIVVKRTAAGWHIEKPIEVAADQTAVDNLVRAIADAQVKRTIDAEAQSLGVYGLDKPDTIVSVALSNGKTLPSLRIGKKAPVGFSAYAQLEGHPQVQLVSSVLHSGTQRDVKDLRDKAVIDFADEDVHSIELVTPQSSIEVVRKDSRWKIVKPKPLDADPDEIRSLLSSLRGLRAQDFVDAPKSLAEYGLEEPREKIAVRVGKDDSRKEVWIGAEKAEHSKNVLYVKRADADTVYAVGTWNWGSLNKDVSALRDKTVLPFDLEKLAAIEVVRRDGENYRLVKESAAGPAPGATPSAEGSAPPAEASWRVAGAKGSASVRIAELAGDLHGLKGYAVAAENPEDLAAYGLAAPAVTFSLLDAEGKPIGRILAGEVGGGESADAYAMAEGGDVVYRIRGYLYSHLDKKKDDFLEAPPAATPRG